MLHFTIFNPAVNGTSGAAAQIPHVHGLHCEPAPSRSSTSPVQHLSSQTDANMAHCSRYSAFLYKQRKLAFSIYKD